MQGQEANDSSKSNELIKLRLELEAAKAKADGHYHALQELSAQAQAS